jgi:hypothetical protein
MTVTIFHQLLDIWPFHQQQQIDEQGQMRYRLTLEEREQLKTLGLQKPIQNQLAEARPLLQRTRQMEKDLEKTLLKRYKEAKALEKKRKKEKEIKKEQP